MDLSSVHCGKETCSCSGTASLAASSAYADRNRHRSRDSCVWCGLDLNPHMTLAVEDDRRRYHLHNAPQIVVDLHGLSLLRDPHLCAVSLLEVLDKVIEIGTETGVIR
jgi:hypothetical protein